MKLALAFVVLVCLGSSASADENILVLGAHSCGKWLASRQDKGTHYQFKQWVYGFVSGSNWRTPSKQARPIDEHAIEAFVDQYCKNNPMHELILAAAAAVEVAGGPRAVHEWKH